MKHYMELTDGICIEAFPRAEQSEEIETDNLALDTTGEFLQMGGGLKRHKKIATCTNEEQLKLFLQNARRLIGESDRIMSDSRMFLASLPIRNGLAYIGTSGFNNPTLGVYIEWWRNNECAWTKDKFGELQPIYYIAGSPLSGRNACAYIGPEGDSRSVQVLNFSQVWHSFVQINTHYTEAKQLYEAYSLEEVIEILFRDSTYNTNDADYTANTPN
ncbi:MAG: hypothetical protein IJX65_06990 [Alistipes sp.]|nr:hypothetical protein [Alistipes sp.]